MPPRTQNSPCSSTGSSRVNPASASRSPSATGSRSIPFLSSIAAASRLSGALSRVRSAAAEATTTVALPFAMACSAAARAEATPKWGAIAAVRVDLEGRKRLDGILERGGRGAFERGEEESRVDAESIHVLVSGDDDDAHGILAMARPRCDIQGLCRWRQAAHVRRRRIHSRPSRGGLEKRLQIERCRGRHSVERRARSRES